MNNRINLLQNYLFILLGVFVPTSIAVTNFIIIGLIAVLWIVDGNFKTKIRYIIASKWMLSLFGLIFLYVLGMLWGDNHLNAGWQFQRLLLLLLFPILATIKIDQQSIKYAVVAFLFTTFVSGLLAILVNNHIISPCQNIGLLLDLVKVAHLLNITIIMFYLPYLFLWPCI